MQTTSIILAASSLLMASSCQSPRLNFTVRDATDMMNTAYADLSLKLDQHELGFASVLAVGSAADVAELAAEIDTKDFSSTKKMHSGLDANFRLLFAEEFNKLVAADDARWRCKTVDEARAFFADGVPYPEGIFLPEHQRDLIARMEREDSAFDYLLLAQLRGFILPDNKNVEFQVDLKLIPLNSDATTLRASATKAVELPPEYIPLMRGNGGGPGPRTQGTGEDPTRPPSWRDLFYNMRS